MFIPIYCLWHLGFVFWVMLDVRQIHQGMARARKVKEVVSKAGNIRTLEKTFGQNRAGGWRGKNRSLQAELVSKSGRALATREVSSFER